MDRVVASVRARLQAEGLPVGVDGVAQRAWLGGDRVRAAQDLRAEVLPTQGPGVPLRLEEVDARPGSGELDSHVHVKPVNDKNVVDLTDVKATSELEEVHVLRQPGPHRPELLDRNAERLGGL